MFRIQKSTFRKKVNIILKLFVTECVLPVWPVVTISHEHPVMLYVKVV